MRLKDDSRNPIVEITNQEYCGECNRHLRFIFGDSVIDIRTNDDGLKKIADAIADHPKSMLSAAQAKLDAAKREIEALGGTVENGSQAAESSAGDNIV